MVLPQFQYFHVSSSDMKLHIALSIKIKFYMSLRKGHNQRSETVRI
jgi:hypothetical protein